MELNSKPQKLKISNEKTASEAEAGQSSLGNQTTTEPHLLWQDSTHAVNTSGGHRSMQAFREPPGQPLGDGDGLGVGVGDGVGDGLGDGPSVVEPMGPYLMSEKVTLESACALSTSLGTPEDVGQVPRADPGLVESTG